MNYPWGRVSHISGEYWEMGARQKPSFSVVGKTIFFHNLTITPDDDLRLEYGLDEDGSMEAIVIFNGELVPQVRLWEGAEDGEIKVSEEAS
jgi:hypothetical protein